jgi:hypothetical protein
MPGFGTVVAWTVVPGAVTYRVYRGEVGKIGQSPIHLTINAADAEASYTVFSIGSSGFASVVDPYFALTQQGDPIYWVDATFANGSVSALSDNATIAMSKAVVGYDLINGFPGPQNLKAVVGPLTTIPGTGAPARNITWTWDPVFLVLYDVDVFQMISPASGGGIVKLSQETLLTSHGPIGPYSQGAVPVVLTPFLGKGYPSGPPYTTTVQPGAMIVFCVGAAHILASPPPKTYRLTTCLTTQVP